MTGKFSNSQSSRELMAKLTLCRNAIVSREMNEMNAKVHTIQDVI